MDPHKKPLVRGRGTGSNPTGRFEPIEIVPDPDYYDPDEPKVRTQYLTDTSRSVISTNESPDIGFNKSVNPYRGCEHGCVYCYARPYHEYLGFSAGLDFETKILVKRNAPDLLRRELTSKKWKPEPLALSGVTDPYQPVERQLEITRGCIEVLAEFRNPVIIITKNHLVTRDIDYLGELSEHDAAAVLVSITTLDKKLARIMEPRTSTPDRRFGAIEALAKAGIPAGVFVAPVIPGLTDHEMPKIIERAADVGATFAIYSILRLPRGVKDLFAGWLDEQLPDHKDKVLNRVKSLREGKMNDTRFKKRMRGTGVHAEQISKMFALACKKAGIKRNTHGTLSTAAFRRPTKGQLPLFE